MADDDHGVSAGAIIVAFLGGATLGAVAALLLAPQPGSETREQLRGYARRTEGQMRDFAEKAGETFDKTVVKSRDFVKSKKSVLGEAFETGREAMRRERKRFTGETSE
ncbi:MAG: YtxH domain-containing protein [Nitrospirota bacterium]|nr:YtxH domain-containing protein [Nitrospirota bacterium]